MVERQGKELHRSYSHIDKLQYIEHGVMMHVLPSSPQNIKGLGRSEQGATDHVKVRVKNDSYGLGANASYEVSTFTILIQHCLTLVMHGNIL